MPASILECQLDAQPDPGEFIRAAMYWHFSPDTGSSFWLGKAKTLGFDPRTDIRGVADLELFPDITDELRRVRVEDLIPRGYGPDAEVVGVYESGGTTGAPKRVVVLRDWWERFVAWTSAALDVRGCPRNVNWLAFGPTGPHMGGLHNTALATERGGTMFAVDADPRWVKKLIAEGRREEAAGYAEHLVCQAAHVLRTQDIGVLATTPALLERLARHEELVWLVNDKVAVINWGGTHLDADTAHLLRSEIFPNVKLIAGYGNTMMLANVVEREDTCADVTSIYDPLAPFITFAVIDPETGRRVAHGERGQVITHHVSKSMLLPHNRERDLATRIAAPPGQPGDAIADVSPQPVFDNTTVVEGVY